MKLLKNCSCFVNNFHAKTNPISKAVVVFAI